MMLILFAHLNKVSANLYVENKRCKYILIKSRYSDIILMKGVDLMPVITRFYGIIIRMYFLQSEHNPPHIHAIYNQDVAMIDFLGNVIDG